MPKLNPKNSPIIWGPIAQKVFIPIIDSIPPDVMNESGSANFLIELPILAPTIPKKTPKQIARNLTKNPACALGWLTAITDRKNATTPQIARDF
jgi:hypothetical protein